MPLANSVSADRRAISISWLTNSGDPIPLELFSVNVHLSIEIISGPTDFAETRWSLATIPAKCGHVLSLIGIFRIVKDDPVISAAPSVVSLIGLRRGANTRGYLVETP